jgi:hypothetical protein
MWILYPTGGCYAAAAWYHRDAGSERPLRPAGQVAAGRGQYSSLSRRL